jgi:hypothetical protein
MAKLDSMIGKMLIAKIPVLDRTKLVHLTLRGVESGGLWVESQEFTEVMLASVGREVSAKTLVMFLPFHQIEYAIAAEDFPSLSERGLGLTT